MRIRNKKTYKKKTFNKRKTKNTVKKNKATRTEKRKIVKCGGEKRKERQDECVVCFEELNNPNNPDITLSCEHTFHIKCILKTCRHMPVPCLCPLCRGVLTFDELNTLGIAPPLPQPLPPNLDNIREFKAYINSKLRGYTRVPLEKLKNVLESFLGTDSLPIRLFDDVAMEFELQKFAFVGPDGPVEFYRYRLVKIIELDQIPPFIRLNNKKYFRYIDYFTAGQSENTEDDDANMLIAYEVNEV